MISRPWWLPEGLSPAYVQAWDAASGWAFAGSPKRSVFEHALNRCGLQVHYPMLIWDRVLTNEEVVFITWALVERLMGIIYLMGPAHVRYHGDMDEDGVCRCTFCRSKERLDD